MRFTDIEGQEAAVHALQSSISHGEIAHAYLFAGPQSTGKLSAALALASALNCTAPTPDGDACGLCVSCRQVHAGQHPDVQVISPDGNQTKINQMRDMIDSLKYAPIRGKQIVVIVEQADTLNPSSENCILKILEEPPSYATLVLLSCNPSALLPTIRSRCRMIRFTRSSQAEIKDAIERRFSLSEDEATLIASCAQGAIGHAIRMASDSAILEGRLAVLEMTRTWPDTPSVAASKYAEMLRKAAEGSQADTDERTRVRKLQGYLDHVLSWYADLLELKVRGDDAPIANVDFAHDLREQVDRYSLRHLQAGIRSIMDTRRYLEGNITAQLALENMLFQLMPDM